MSASPDGRRSQEGDGGIAGSAARSGGVEDPALVAGQRPLHRRPAGGALGALRAQPGRRGPDRAHRGARGRDGDHRRRPRGGEADPADAAQVQLCAGQPADPGARTWCASSASRSRPWSRRAREEAEDIADLRRGRDRARLPAVVDARAALARRRAARPCRGAPATSWSKDGSRRRASTPASRPRIGGSRSTSARAGRTRCRWRRAPAHAAFDAASRPRHAHLHDADAAPDAHRHCRSARHAGIAICA